MEQKPETYPSSDKEREKTKKEITGKEEAVYTRSEVLNILEGFGVPHEKFLEILNIGEVVEIDTFTEENISGAEVECLGITYAAEKKGAARPKYTIIKTPFEKGAQFQYLRPTKPGKFSQMI